jgi:hypothetical protein
VVECVKQSRMASTINNRSTVGTVDNDDGVPPPPDTDTGASDDAEGGLANTIILDGAAVRAAAIPDV